MSIVKRVASMFLLTTPTKRVSGFGIVDEKGISRDVDVSEHRNRKIASKTETPLITNQYTNRNEVPAVISQTETRTAPARTKLNIGGVVNIGDDYEWDLVCPGIGIYQEPGSACEDIPKINPQAPKDQFFKPRIFVPQGAGEDRTVVDKESAREVPSGTKGEIIIPTIKSGYLEVQKLSGRKSIIIEAGRQVKISHKETGYINDDEVFIQTKVGFKAKPIAYCFLEGLFVVKDDENKTCTTQRMQIPVPLSKVMRKFALVRSSSLSEAV